MGSMRQPQPACAASVRRWRVVAVAADGATQPRCVGSVFACRLLRNRSTHAAHEDCDSESERPKWLKKFEKSAILYSWLWQNNSGL
ncbi:MAG: hypothetical protein Ta2A_10340 [Treponemataceae bacterium]|nr:MAG: hypothetical protein Ta2A_10340 [Treponemataceae bacterium]